MHRYLANSFFIVLLIIVGIRANAQTNTVSNPTSEHENNPYSRYGIGQMSYGDNVALQGMGDISAAFESPYEMNTDNPASYTFLKLTTYEAGLYAITRNVASGDLSYQTGTATLSYMNIGVPIGKKAGLCIGVRPVSTMFYNLADTSQTNIGQTQGLYNGSGSLNYFYIGAAYKIKSFSFGVNAGYMFGQINTSTQLNNIDTAVLAYNSNFVNYTKIGGIYWDAGVMYEHAIKKDLLLRIGATLSLKQSLNATQTLYSVSTYALIDTFVQDTASTGQGVNGKIVLPMSYSFGVQLASTDKWMLGINYAATEWTQFRSFGSPDSLANSYKISIGGEYTSNAANTRNYWSRVTFRGGLYFGRDEVFLANTYLNLYGITAGASLPVKRSTSHIHVGLDLGTVGTKSEGLIKETYVRFSVGFSFNDRWFVKRKYD
jgi:long-subunit fatty acid transport protein